MKGWVLILGATSAIARATASTLAAAGYHLCLAGRDIDELQRDAANLAIRFGNQTCHREFDVDRLETHGAFFSGYSPSPAGSTAWWLPWATLAILRRHAINHNCSACC
jgi:decaprenylphospho-beta-D-erythro-pentofuranosid-2-ulose 2-reductase